ncbi:hypothetical protein P9314_22170 [Paenibacillus validus]|uniref:hypothetical protein n=1 Tax=Paenibacillus validus TaxID=44253 RepID=UPI000FD92564|nr:hypothetical protein [Paenibacillus validus]MED4603335.1 hypothetical protein [Paenibacillus validus]MED4608962.1 hypothetical protein [Paenibacillus validus]
MPQAPEKVRDYHVAAVDETSVCGIASRTVPVHAYQSAFFRYGGLGAMRYFLCIVRAACKEPRYAFVMKL